MQRMLAVGKPGSAEEFAQETGRESSGQAPQEARQNSPMQNRIQIAQGTGTRIQDASQLAYCHMIRLQLRSAKGRETEFVMTLARVR